MNQELTILIIEDDATLLFLYNRYLHNLGYKNIITAGDGITALEQLNKNNFDLIISDWDLPGMNGLELLDKLRSQENLKNIPFILMTGHKDKEKELKSIEQGINKFLLKPADVEKFQQAINECFSN
jgi:two-component system, chemotaxis family, chemotaxis protein CheY